MLGRIAVRMAVVEALKGRTLVGNNVLDSEIGVISTDADGNVTTEQRSPFIAVYTDTGETEPDGIRGLIGSSRCDLVIEIGVTATMVERTADGTEEVAGFPATDANFELMLDLLVRQVVDALADPDDVWAVLFQALVVRIGKVVRQRVGHHQLGTRIAAQELRIPLTIVDEPECGVVLDPDGAFGMWFALLPEDEDEAAPDLARGLLMIRSYLAALQEDEAESWELARQRLGLSAAEIISLGLAPAAPTVAVVQNLDGSSTPEIIS